MKAVDNNDQAAARDGVERSIRVLANAASIEVTPQRILAGPALCDTLPLATSVYVPFLPRADFRDTVAACRRLVSDGMIPVPHVTPRAVRSRAEMRHLLSALLEAGVDALLLIAGDRPQAAGPYSSTLDLLESGLLLDHGFRRLGIAGHPEGHPSVSAATLEQSLAIKRDYAEATETDLWIVTQFVFSTHPTVQWLARTREIARYVPVRVGMPGPARLSTLMAYAAHCGVTASARVLRRRPSAARLLGRWTPDGLLRDFAQCRMATSAPLFNGVHLFPFGGVGETSNWLAGLRGSGSGNADAASLP